MRLVSERPTESTDLLKELLERSQAFPKKIESFFSLAVRGYSNWGNKTEVLKMLKKMKDLGFDPRLRTYTHVLKCLSETLNEEEFEQFYPTLLKEIIENLSRQSINLTNKEYEHILHTILRLKKSADSFKVLLDVLNQLATEDFIPSKLVCETIVLYFDSEASVSRGVKFGGEMCSKCEIELAKNALTEKQYKTLEENIDKLVLQEYSIENIGKEKKKSLKPNMKHEPRSHETLDHKLLQLLKDSKVSEWDRFKQYIANGFKLPPKYPANIEVDCLIDGANIAYYKQNYKDGKFRFSNIASIIEEVEKRTKNWLIILHESHIFQLNRSLKSKDPFVRHEATEEKRIYSEWKLKGRIYDVARGANDDWFWLYACVKIGKEAIFVSNDILRDHHKGMFGTTLFKSWRRCHQAHFDAYFDKGSKRLRGTTMQYPRKIKMSTQVSECGNYIHIPQLVAGASDPAAVRAGHSARYNTTTKSLRSRDIEWVCIDRSKTPSKTNNQRTITSEGINIIKLSEEVKTRIVEQEAKTENKRQEREPKKRKREKKQKKHKEKKKKKKH
eukprot:augustus_masked-scaffold_11-processed-gene-3.46-mRNA-1 protein AED:0.43 eAED:0.43 QI:0/-1/0/1/-1/1/1/0/556